MAKIRPIDDRLTTLVDDEDFEDAYRPENLAAPRAPRRAPQNVAPRSRAQASSYPNNGDFADPGARTRSRRARAAMLADGYEEDGDPGYSGYEDEFDTDEEADRNSTRSRRRVAVARSARRKSWLGSKWGRIGIALAALAVLGLLTSAFLLVRGFFLHDPRFRIDSASSIQILGNSEISRADLMSAFAPDLGHNIFTVPLAARRAQLQQLPWVQSAIVMRLLPNQLRVSIVERVPAAFVREGSTIGLVDTTGVILSMPPSMLAARHYSFPVVVGINASDPAETRADRMQLYEKFVTALDGSADTTVSSKGTPVASAPKVSQQLSEVDVSDTEDVRALMPSAGTDILVHFGDQDFASRYRIYRQHLPQWRLQYPHLAAIDLRYDRQTVLEMSKTQDAAGSTGDAVDTTPTLAAGPTPARPKPSAATHAPQPTPHPAVKKPAHPVRAAVKPPIKAAVKKTKSVPAYAQPFDNPHVKPAALRSNHG